MGRINVESNSFRANEEKKKSELDEKSKYLGTISEVSKTCQENIEKARVVRHSCIRGGIC